MVNVDDVADPEGNDHPYDNLVLKEEQKTLLMAFADNQVRNTGFDDFVKHKGMDFPHAATYSLLITIRGGNYHSPCRTAGRGEDSYIRSR
jgi:hypothetical protein